MTFKRELSDEIIENLQKEPLYNNCLLNDIKNFEVFPAIRNNEIHFYHKGGRLFKYTNSGFYTNIKYAFVCDDYDRGDISEKTLGELKPIQNFIDGYENIKKCCATYNEKSEAYFVSTQFKHYSFLKDKTKDDIILLDIEAALESTNEDKNLDRFDMVLLNKKTGVLKIVEAKLYENPELKQPKDKGKDPQVIDQITRYEDNIESKYFEILGAYHNYIKIINKLFGLELEKPTEINRRVGLFYFDFGEEHRKDAKFKYLEEKLNSKIKSVYSKGHPDREPADLKSCF